MKTKITVKKSKLSKVQKEMKTKSGKNELNVILQVPPYLTKAIYDDPSDRSPVGKILYALRRHYKEELKNIEKEAKLNKNQ